MLFRNCLSRSQLLVLPARLLLKLRNMLEVNPPQDSYLCKQTTTNKQQNSKNSNVLRFLSSVLGKVAKACCSAHWDAVVTSVRSAENGDSVAVSHGPGTRRPWPAPGCGACCLVRCFSAFPTSARCILHQWEWLLLFPCLTGGSRVSERFTAAARHTANRPSSPDSSEAQFHPVKHIAFESKERFRSNNGFYSLSLYIFSSW